MSLDKHVLCVSTTKPTISLSPSGGGGTMTVVDPMTGSCLSSLRVTADMSGKNALGIKSASAFPLSFLTRTGNNSNPLAIAYGTNRAKKGDTYAMLVSIRSAASPPILHWKCRLPEADLTAGLSSSPCGHYVVGGGASGTCFVWNSVGSGSMLRTFKAHYRAVTCLAWSDCGRYLVTAGADGMVHLYLLMELVDQSGRNSKRALTPLHTWSFHHFPVTCLTTMDSGRMASGAEDGHIVIMELFSKKTVATIKVPDGITCMTYNDNRLFVGTISGTIFSMDLDAYAMHETEKQGATLSQAERKRQEEYLSEQERIFGKPSDEDGATTRLFRSEWIGHDRSVSAIAYLVEGHEHRLISGDQRGELRIWDVESRICLKVVQPWSQSSGATTGVAKKPADAPSTSVAAAAAAAAPGTGDADSGGHPISSIMIIAQPLDAAATNSGGMFGSSSGTAHHRGQSSIAALFPPLQKYSNDEQQRNDATLGSLSSSSTTHTMAVPLLKQNRGDDSLTYWQARTMGRKRQRTCFPPPATTSTSDMVVDTKNEAPTSTTHELDDALAKIAQLEKELEAKSTEVARWEAVNNKLLAKLKAGK